MFVYYEKFKQQTMNKKQKLALIFTILIYATIYSSISLVNHYNFRTHAHDLGIETNTCWDYAHFRVNDCMMMQPQFKNVLSDHFSLLHMIYAPLVFVFGTYTLLLIQIVVILLAGFGIYKYFSFKSGDHWLGILAAIHFYSIFGIFTAIAFDFHNNVIGAMLVPWFFYFFEKDKRKTAALFFILLMCAKENMALWSFFIALGLLTVNFKNKSRRYFLMSLATLAITYFIVVMKYIMPSLANEGRDYLHFTYNALGNNFGEAVVNIFKHPIKTFSLLFENQDNDPFQNMYKSELHFIVLISGGIIFLYRPEFLIMVLPIYAQKLFSDYGIMWGLAYHYSIEFVPILCIALFSWIMNFEKKNTQYKFAALGIFMTMAATAYTIKSAISIPWMKDHIQINTKAHFKRDWNIQDVYDLMKLIPPNANVSAANEIASHLSLRDYIYLFPTIGNAEYIILLNDDSAYPLSPEQNKIEIDKLLVNPEWNLVSNKGIVYLFQRKK